MRKARVDPLSPYQLVGCPSQDGARVAIDQRNSTIQVDSEQDDIRRVQVPLCTVPLLTQRFLGFGKQYRRVALGIDDRIDLTGQQCLDRGFSLGEPLRQVLRLVVPP